QASAETPDDATVLAVPVFAGMSLAEGGGADIDLGFLAACGFEGPPGQTQSLMATDGSVVLAVGVGDRDSLDADGLRRAGAAVARARGPARHVALTLTAAAGRLDRTM